MNTRLRDTNVRPLSQLWLLALLLIHALTVNAETFQSATLKRDDGSDIHYYLIAHSESATSDSLVLLLQGSTCRSVAPRLKEYREYGDIAPGADILMIEKYGLTADHESSGQLVFSSNVSALSSDS